jgi:transposase-like protein
MERDPTRLDATYHKARIDGRVLSQATVVAIGVTAAGARLVISGAHEGLQQAIKTVLGGTVWQRCRVHFMCSRLAVVPHSLREPVAAIVRTIFGQPDHASAPGQRQKVADGLRTRLPAAAARGPHAGPGGDHQSRNSLSCQLFA